MFTAERIAQREMDGPTQRVKIAWLYPGLAVERPQLALDGLFLSSFAEMGLENCPVTLCEGSLARQSLIG